MKFEDVNDEASIGMLGMTGRKLNRRYPTHYEKFIDAIRRLPPPPCKGCPLREACAKEELACEQFWQYANTVEGRPDPWKHDSPPTKEPSRRIYKLIYEGNSARTPVRSRRYKGYLSDETVRAVRAVKGQPNWYIADKFKLSVGVVQRIRSGDGYRWVA